MEQNLAAIFANAPGGDHRLTWLTRVQPLGNSIDVEVDDPVLGQIALNKSLVLRPQSFRDLAHRRARQQPTPAFVRKCILDVPGRQPARIKLDCQILERLCATRQILPDLRDERLRRIAHLRRRKLSRALSRLHPSGPVSIPVALRFAVDPLVTLPANPVANLALQGFLQDQPRRQQHQARPIRRRPQTPFNQGPKLLACLLGCGYSLHRDAPWGQSAPTESPFSCFDSGRVHPNPFFQQVYAFTKFWSYHHSPDYSRSFPEIRTIWAGR